MQYQDSLVKIVDALNESIFYGKEFKKEQQEQALSLIAGRQCRSGPHCGMFEPVEKDRQDGFRLFTGERLHTRLGPRNILSAESARLFVLFGMQNPAFRESHFRVNQKLLNSCFAADLCVVGECAHSGVGFMRYLAAGGTPDSEHRLKEHLRIMSGHRQEQGGWKGYPFYYSVLVLMEIDLPEATAEIRHAAHACDKALHRTHKNPDGYQHRRMTLLERALCRC